MNQARFTGLKNKENTDRNVLRDYLTPVYAALIALYIRFNYGHVLVQPAPLAGNATITANVDNPMIGDEMEFLFTGAGTVTFGTGFAATGTLAVASRGYAKFMFNGTVWQECSRALTA